jgi:chromosomal replication initiator protein
MAAALTTHDVPSLDLIIGTVVEQLGVSRMNIMSQRRDARFVEARWVAMWLAREMTPLSYPEIGRALGDRDHTTVMHAVAGIRHRIATDEDFYRRVAGVRAAVGRRSS